MPKFHETGYGRRFFEKQLPDLIKAVERVADALEERNELLKRKSYKNDLTNNQKE